MTSDEAYQQLFDNIKFNLKHQDYDRVCQLAEDYRIFNTGKGIEKKLKRFTPREDEEMFEQRVNLTIAITPAAASSIKKPFNKVPRTQPITRKIAPLKDAFKDAVAEIEDRIKNFYGSENNVGGLDYYFQNRFVDLSFDDPNMWVIVEFGQFDHEVEKPMPHPFEASAKQAINFSIKNNIVEWLIIAIDIKFQENINGTIHLRDGKKYTIFADNDAWTFEQVSSDQDKRVLPNDGQVIEIEKRGWFITTHDNTLTKKVPAFRVGYVRDIETNGRTYVNPYHDAVCYFEKSIKQVSEYDLSTFLHLFPQKVVRTRFDCPGENGQNCDKGYLTDGTQCKRCKGIGRLVHTSAQDMVEVEWADDPAMLIPIDEMIKYVELPIELLKLQKEWVDELKVDAHQTVFNSTALLRTSTGTGSAETNGAPIAVTATQQNDNMESVYDTLTPFGEKIATAWITIVELIATILDNEEKVIIIYRPPSKYKLKTRQDLYAERATLKTSGAPAFVVDSVDDELAQDVYADDGDALMRYMIKKDHYPFVGKTTEEIAQLLASTVVMKRTKVLYSYFDEIFTELEREWKARGADFYGEKVEVRQQAIDVKVDNILKQLSDENATAVNFKLAALTNPINNNPADNQDEQQNQNEAA